MKFLLFLVRESFLDFNVSRLFRLLFTNKGSTESREQVNLLIYLYLKLERKSNISRLEEVLKEKIRHFKNEHKLSHGATNRFN